MALRDCSNSIALVAILLGLLAAGCDRPASIARFSRLGVFRYDPSTDEWKRIGMLPARRVWPACAEAGGIIYMTGGSGDAYWSPRRECYSYDPAAGKWDKLRDLPFTRFKHSAVFLGGELHVLGGHGGPVHEPLATVLRYDVANREWVPLPDMTTARMNFGAAVLAGQIYVMGGEGLSGPGDGTESYDPGTSIWQPLMPMPGESLDITAETVGTVIYAVGSMKIPPWTAEIDIYDPASDTWSRGPTMPTPFNLEHLESAVIGTEIFVHYHLDGEPIGLVSFDTVSASWTIRAERPRNAWGAGMDTSGGLIYSFGGGTHQRSR